MARPLDFAERVTEEVSPEEQRDYDWRAAWYDNLVIDGACPDCSSPVLVARDGSKACQNILCRFAHGGLR